MPALLSPAQCLGLRISPVILRQENQNEKRAMKNSFDPYVKESLRQSVPYRVKSTGFRNFLRSEKSLQTIGDKE